MTKNQTLACFNCDAAIPVPDRAEWDIETTKRKGAEVVVSIHRSMTCPACGATGHPHLPMGSDAAAQEGRDRLASLFPGLVGDDGKVPEIGNVVRELVDPPVPLDEWRSS